MQVGSQLQPLQYKEYTPSWPRTPVLKHGLFAVKAKGVVVRRHRGDAMLRCSELMSTPDFASVEYARYKVRCGPVA